MERITEADDDVSLYRLFGFSLFIAIKFRKNGQLRKHYHPSRRRRYALELKILKSIVETDKSVLPGTIKLQDRGKMTFPHKALIPFMRKCSRAIKNHLNYKQYKIQGRRIILFTKQCVLKDEELISDFEDLMKFHSSTADIATIANVYRDLLTRVVNTMANQFLINQDMLERIASNKGIDAEMALRDKLKAYAIDTRTKIKL